MDREWYFERWRAGAAAPYMTSVMYDFDLLLVQAANARARHERFRVRPPVLAPDEQLQRLAELAWVERI